MILVSATQVLVGASNQEKALGPSRSSRRFVSRSNLHRMSGPAPAWPLVILRQIQHLTGGMQNPTTETGAWCLFVMGRHASYTELFLRSTELNVLCEKSSFLYHSLSGCNQCSFCEVAIAITICCI